MSDWHYEPGNRFDSVTIPVIWVALVLSLLLHIAVLWTSLPRIRMHSLDENAKQGEASSALVVQLAPRPSPPTSPPPSPPPPSAARASAAPPVIALKQRVPDRATRPTAPSAAERTPAPAPSEGDLMSYIEARRRARAESAQAESQGSASNTPSPEDDNERSKRILAANLGLDRTPSFGRDPKNGGGIFQLQRVGHDDAEFLFFGWNKDIRRNAKQTIEVRRGDSGDIHVAVIRRMIAIIREHERGDFVWVSQRLGREVTLSARPGDNAGLEEFMLREFFTDARVPH